jgi:cytochrome c554/c'-like protein
MFSKYSPGKILFLSALAFVFILSTVTLTTAAENSFVGVKGCICHNKDVVKTWKAGPHAGSFATLAGDEAKKIATEKGIADPQKADECLSCHVTAHGVKAELINAKKFKMEDGVQCESCHGPGSAYKSPKIMSKKLYKEDREAAHKADLAAGLMEVDEKTCTACHNEKSPTFKGFKLKEYMQKIKHWPDERDKYKMEEGSGPK